jgi:hypothetical protein
MKPDLGASPELNPLSLFIKDYTDSTEDLLRTKSSFELDAGDLLPDQIPSIIDERAVIRYYKDPSRRPIIISEGLQGTVKQLSSKDEDAECSYDVSLTLDVTTGCGGKIWPAAEVLGQYIASKRSDGQWKGKVAVELGAGTGLVGLLAAKATEIGEVWITDQM